MESSETYSADHRQKFSKEEAERLLHSAVTVVTAALSNIGFSPPVFSLVHWSKFLTLDQRILYDVRGGTPLVRGKHPPIPPSPNLLETTPPIFLFDERRSTTINEDEDDQQGRSTMMMRTIDEDNDDQRVRLSTMPIPPSPPLYPPRHVHDEPTDRYTLTKSK